MSSTLAELTLDIKSGLSILDAPSIISDHDIKNWLNEAQNDITQKARHLKESYYLEPDEDVDRYQLPSNFIKEFRVFFNGTKVEEITFEEIEEKGITPGYIIWRGEILIYPPPTAQAEEISMEYYRRPEKMEDDDDTPEIPVHYEHLLIVYAMFRAMQKSNRYGESREHYQQYLQDISIMKREFSRAPRIKTIKVIRAN